MSVAEKKREAAQKHAQLQEERRATRQRARALNVPERHANAIWATSLTGCLIHLCEYGDDEDKDQLQRHYWNVYQTYVETLQNESKALGSPSSFSGESGIAYDVDSDSYIEWCKRCRRKADLMRRHLKDLQASVRSTANVHAVVSLIMNRDNQHMYWAYHKHMFPQLRMVLDSLDVYFSGSDD